MLIILYILWSLFIPTKCVLVPILWSLFSQNLMWLGPLVDPGNLLGF